MAFWTDQRREGVCHMDIYRRNILCRGNSRCKGSKAAVCLGWSENDKKALGSSVVGDKVRDGVTDQIM